MKNLFFRVALAATLGSLVISIQPMLAQGTAITYQGQLTAGGQSANGSFDLAFSLYNAAADGTQVGATVTNLATGVTNGLFTVTLDFGLTPYDGQLLWLQIAVSPAGSNTFTALSPLQALTSTPYAVQSLNAATAANLTGSITVAQLPSAILTNGETNVSIAGAFSGSGAGLSNLNAAQITSGTISQAQLPATVVTYTPSGAVQTNVYATAGTNTVTVPAGVNQMTAKLWGAGGGSGYFGGTGGGGAFVETVLSVAPGQTFTVVVGQHGDALDNNAGGVGSDDAQGGTTGQPEYNGQGGQASSLFYDANGMYIMNAVAGGGGGSGTMAGSAAPSNGGAGGNPGAAGGEGSNDAGSGGAGGGSGVGGAGGDSIGWIGSPGTNYAAGATSTGIASLALAGGNGGTSMGSGGGNSGGGGGGGYGGGGGAVTEGGGGGGGSYGQNIIGGTNALAGNNSDPNYVASAGNGGSPSFPPSSGQDGLVVIIFGNTALANIPATVEATQFIGNGTYLTNLNAANLTGTISGALLPPNLDQLTANNGGALTNLNASQLTNGTVPLSALPANLVPLAANNGGALTNLNASQLTNGTVALQRLPGGLAQLANNQNFTGNNTFATNVIISNTVAVANPLVTVEGNQTGGFGQATVSILNSNTTSSTAPALRVQANGNASGGALSVSTQGTGLIAQFGNGNAFVADIQTNGTVDAVSFNTTSDRNAKADFAPVNVQSVLDRVATLPITEWHFKADADTRHIGPMAQDFRAAFHVGTDEKHIATVDEDGVALAAIQGLNQKVTEQAAQMKAKDTEIQTLKQQNESLAQRLNELETTVKALQK